jgi:hypothetical protein
METATQDVLVELNDTVDRIAVYFKYDQIDVDNIKTIRGRRWDPDARHWTVPMDMKSARRLREIFGERMRLGNAMRVWAKEQVRFERNLRSLGNANDAELLNTPKPILDVIAGRPFEHPSIPKNHALRKSRPERSYQRADIRMMSMAQADPRDRSAPHARPNVADGVRALQRLQGLGVGNAGPAAGIHGAHRHGPRR